MPFSAATYVLLKKSWGRVGSRTSIRVQVGIAGTADIRFTVYTKQSQSASHDATPDPLHFPSSDREIHMSSSPPAPRPPPLLPVLPSLPSPPPPSPKCSLAGVQGLPRVLSKCGRRRRARARAVLSRNLMDCHLGRYENVSTTFQHLEREIITIGYWVIAMFFVVKDLVTPPAGCREVKGERSLSRAVLAALVLAACNRVRAGKKSTPIS